MEGQPDVVAGTVLKTVDAYSIRRGGSTPSPSADLTNMKIDANENDSIFLEFGSGNKSGKNGWITIDKKCNCDLQWDLCNGIPFPDESISMIYSSHFLEHLTYQEAQILLEESLRVLKKDGIFSICVPNARIFMDAYFNIEKLPEYLMPYKKARNNTTRIDIVNYVAYCANEHKYMFDEENLIYILKEKGFRNVKLRDFDPNLDNPKKIHQSIYAVGEK